VGAVFHYDGGMYAIGVIWLCSRFQPEMLAKAVPAGLDEIQFIAFEFRLSALFCPVPIAK